MTGLAFIFIMGVLILASMALLPPMLSTIFGYPTITIGVVIGPRGVGTMISMLVVGPHHDKVDARILVVIGFLLTAQSLYTMSSFSPQMDNWLILSSGVIQGLGMGMVFVPLSTVAFATLDARFRTDATALFSLVRNLGSSIGVSVVSVLLVRNTQVNHAELSAYINPFNPNLWAVSPAAAGGDPTALSQVDGHGQYPSDDDLLRQRLQTADDDDAACRPVCLPAAQAKGGTGRRRRTRRAYGLTFADRRTCKSRLRPMVVICPAPGSSSAGGCRGRPAHRPGRSG